MEIRPLTGALGAEMLGADVRRDADWQGIRQAFIDYSVISIRKQSITPDQHLEFGRRWGAINDYQGYRRHMRRVTINGGAITAA